MVRSKRLLIVSYDDETSPFWSPWGAGERANEQGWAVQNLWYTKRASRRPVKLTRYALNALSMADVVLFLGNWREDKHTRFLHSLCVKTPELRIVYNIKDL
jgi:hypothetical protein